MMHAEDHQRISEERGIAMKKAGQVFLLIMGFYALSFLCGPVMSCLGTGAWMQILVSPREANAGYCGDCAYSIDGFHALCDPSCASITDQKIKNACIEGCESYKAAMASCRGRVVGTTADGCVGTSWCTTWEGIWDACIQSCFDKYPYKKHKDENGACCKSCNFGNQKVSPDCWGTKMH